MAKILVIDDDKYIVAWIQKLLQEHHYDVLTACSSKEGLQRAKQEKPDLILLDVIMPCLDGYEVLRRLKMDKETQIIPVAMVTVLGNAEDRIKAIEAGCEDFISKPIDEQELLARVKSLLRIKFLHDEAGAALEYAESIVNTVREPLIILDQDLRVVSASRAFYEFFKVDPKETAGQLIYDLGNKQWDIPKLRELLETILSQKATFDNYEVEHDFAGIGRRIMLLNARQIQRVLGKERIILLAIEDITERKGLQEKMEASEERFRRAFETSQNVLLLVHKTQGDILNSNEAAQKLFGYSQEEFSKKKLWELGVVKGDAEFQEAVAKSEKDGVIHYEEIVIKTKQGLNINGEVFLVDREKVVQCNIRNTTERKKTEQELIFNNIILRTQQESSMDGILVVDEKGKILSFNQRFVDMWGVPRATVELRQDEPVLRLITDKMANPEEFVCKVKHLYEAKGETCIDEIFLKDGRAFERYTVPMLGAEERYFGRVWYFRDITERKRAEDDLKRQARELAAGLIEARESHKLLMGMLDENNKIRERVAQSEEMFRNIFDDAGDGILITDLESKKFFMCNKAICRMLGFTREEIQALSVADVHPEKDLQHIIGEMEKQRQVDTGARTLGNNIAMKRKDGTIVYVDISSTTINILGKRYAIGLFHDLSEHREIEDLKKVDKLKKDFISNMSHELRTPLNAVIGFSEVLVDQKFGALNETQKDYLNDILESGRFLLSLINDILDLAKIESGKMELAATEFSLRELLEHSLIFVKEKALKHSIELSLEIDEKVGRIRADERKVRQIVFNLLSNAVKFTPNGGKVGIKARIDGLSAQVTVWDTGIGITQEDLPKLFMPFTQLESPLAKKYEGTGLGLSLTKELVELHKGKIFVQSQGLGHGASFIFSLPVGVME